jgi:ribosomal protein S18 acetylase RimI-like enzyme
MSTTEPALTLQLPVVIREAREDDVEALEWFGLFTPHREIIRDAWRRHVAGENLMLVAEANHLPIGQAWIDLARHADESTGLLWAVRVAPFFQNLGIGARLLEAAEQALVARGFRWALIGVEKWNEAARRLYLRQGYEPFGELRESYTYTPPGSDTPVEVPIDEWMLRKELGGG